MKINLIIPEKYEKSTIEPGTWKLLEGTDRIYSMGKSGTLGTHIATIAYKDKEVANIICKAVNEYPTLIEQNKELLSALDDAEHELGMWAKSFTQDEDTPKVLETIRGLILKYMP